MMPLWNSILKTPTPNSRQSPVEIANLIKKAIINNSLPLGSRFPSKKEIGRHLKKSQSFMDIVWSILQLEFSMIETKGTNGTYIAASVPQGRGKIKTDLMTSSKPFDLRIFYDEDSITRKDTQMSRLKIELAKSSKKFEIIRALEKSVKIIPGLIRHFRLMVNNLTAGCYGEEELIYMYHFAPLLNSFCQIHLKSNEYFVLARPSSMQVRNALPGNFKNVRYVQSGESGIDLTELEALCETGKVGIVLVNSRSSYALHRKLDTAGINRLLELKKVYKFILIEHDCYLDFHSQQSNLLMEASHQQKADVVFIGPASMIDPELHSINIMAGNYDLISPVKNYILRTNIMLPPDVAYTWNDLMDRRELRRDEFFFYEQMLDVNRNAREFLQATHLWKLEGISRPDSWVLHLEPLEGKLPYDIYSRLQSAGISIKDPAIYDFGKDRFKGIEISLANYVNNSQLIHHLEQFNNCVKKQILLR